MIIDVMSWSVYFWILWFAFHLFQDTKWNYIDHFDHKKSVWFWTLVAELSQWSSINTSCQYNPDEKLEKSTIGNDEVRNWPQNSNFKNTNKDSTSLIWQKTWLEIVFIWNYREEKLYGSKWWESKLIELRIRWKIQWDIRNEFDCFFCDIWKD